MSCLIPQNGRCGEASLLHVACISHQGRRFFKTGTEKLARRGKAGLTNKVALFIH